MGYIHRQVVEHICKISIAELQPEQRTPTGIADIINYDTREIWEVKPVSYYLNSYKKIKADSQLERYLIGMPGYRRGGFDGIISPDHFPSEDGKYEIHYVNLGDGIIIYSYEPKIAISEVSKEIQKEINVDLHYSEQTEEDVSYISQKVNQGKNKGYVEEHIGSSFAKATVSAVLVAAIVYVISAGGGGGGGIRNLLSDKMNWH